MKTTIQPIRPRAAWLLLAAPALFATPAVAQDAPAAPPPVRATVPQATAPATPPPVAQTPPPSRETGRPVTSTATDGASKTVLSPEAQAALAEARERPAARPARATPPVRQVTRTTTTRSTTTQAAPAPAAVAPAPAPVTPAPEAVAPAPAPVAEAPVAETAAPVADSTETTTTESSGTPIWPLALIVIAILAIGGFFFMRSRRSSIEDQYEPEANYYEEPASAPVADGYAEPTPAYVAPAAAAAAVTPALDRAEEPVIATEEATIVEAEAEEVAALTDGAAPVRNRPWLEFAMRPVRAGTSIDEALVEIELTVANAGNIAAEDVRVSAFMLADANASEMERMMIDPPSDGSVEPVTIEPGEGTRIDATLAALKSDVGEAGEFTPVVVADARYRLPDGSEGRTSASFVVGVSREGGTLSPIDLADRVMRDDIEARLHGEPQHA